MERTVIMYHGGCPDGFGGAYAAWKKFGDAAEYRPMSYGDPAPGDLAGASVYLVDFCYDQARMDAIKAAAASLTVLDHHEGTEDVVKTMPEFVYDAGRSGATIAWSYFHPDTPVPELLAHVEDDDLFRFALPDTRALITYVTAHPFSFSVWDKVASALEGDYSRKELLVIANAYAEYFELLAEMSVDHAKLVEFEGYRCYFATAHPLKPLKSLVGNRLAKKLPPIGLVVTAHPKGFGVSIRSDGSVDVSAIARKYGGNGHPASSGFAIPAGGPMPWKLIEDAKENDGARD